MRINWSLGDWVPVLRRLPASAGRAVGLTIDDAPTPEATPPVLDLLDQVRNAGPEAGLRGAAKRAIDDVRRGVVAVDSG